MLTKRSISVRTGQASACQNKKRKTVWLSRNQALFFSKSPAIVRSSACQSQDRRNPRIRTLPAERPWSGWETGQGRTGNGLVSNPILTVRADPVCEETNRTGVIFLIPDMRVLKPPNKLIISVENIDLCKRNAKKRNPQKISYLELCRPGSSKA